MAEDTEQMAIDAEESAAIDDINADDFRDCLLYTSPSPRD